MKCAARTALHQFSMNASTIVWISVANGRCWRLRTDTTQRVLGMCAWCDNVSTHLHLNNVLADRCRQKQKLQQIVRVFECLLCVPPQFLQSKGIFSPVFLPRLSVAPIAWIDFVRLHSVYSIPHWLTRPIYSNKCIKVAISLKFQARSRFCVAVLFYYYALPSRTHTYTLQTVAINQHGLCS